MTIPVLFRPFTRVCEAMPPCAVSKKRGRASGAHACPSPRRRSYPS
jgi:hypothetical protein